MQYLAERQDGVVGKARAALRVRERLLEVVALVPQRRELVFGTGRVSACCWWGRRELPVWVRR
jgi:hypothetical protein